MKTITRTRMNIAKRSRSTLNDTSLTTNAIWVSFIQPIKDEKVATASRAAFPLYHSIIHLHQYREKNK